MKDQNSQPTFITSQLRQLISKMNEEIEKKQESQSPQVKTKTKSKRKFNRKKKQKGKFNKRLAEFYIQQTKNNKMKGKKKDIEIPQ